MIPKGNQRAGGQQLATHLLNAYDNDRVEVVEVRGAIAQDLHGAFAEWYAESKATDCRKYLYSLSINPDHTQGPFTREHYYDFICRTEKSLGLANQPRAVVFHVKHGREHCHIVWSRIDTEKMKAVQLSHDRQKLRAVAQEYARDHNLVLPPGMQNNRGKDRFPDHQKTENLAEKQQEERTGISKQQRRDQITKAWRETKDAQSLVRELEANGYLLARGDKRAYVVVDLYGEIHSLSRQLVGVKAKELKSRLSAYNLDKLPWAAQAQDYARDKRQALLLESQKREAANKQASLAERTATAKAEAQKLREDLQKAHILRRADLEAKRQQLVERHTAERKALSDLQGARNADIARERSAKQPKGVLAFIARVTGFNALTAFRQNLQDRKTGQEYRSQKEALARRHSREMENFSHHERGLASLEKRERRSLETALRREVFRRIAAPAKSRAAAAELNPQQRAKAEKAREIAGEFREAAAPRERGQDAFELTDEQRAKISEFKRAAAETSAPARKPQRGRLSAAPDAKRSPQEKVSAKFNEAAGGAAASGSLSAKFKEKADKPAPAKTETTVEKKQPPQPPEKSATEKAGGARLRDIKENAADLTAAQRKALDLAKEFSESAGAPSRRKEREQDGHGRDRHYRTPAVDYSLRR